MFALPYAGGSACIYRDWCSLLKPAIEVCPYEYAGHASRFSEKFFSSIEEAAEDVSEWIRKQQPKEYVIYGHSMGSLVAIESAYVLERKNMAPPKAVIVAACRPPHLREKGKQLGALSQEELMKYMISRGQYESEILESEELLAILSDIMYADIKIYAKYKRSYESGKIHVPLIALAGQDDDATSLEDMEEWSKYTDRSFEFHMCKGNHFFAFNEKEEFMEDLLTWCIPYLELREKQDLKAIHTKLHDMVH